MFVLIIHKSQLIRMMIYLKLHDLLTITTHHTVILIKFAFNENHNHYYYHVFFKNMFNFYFIWSYFIEYLYLYITNPSITVIN